LKLPMVKEPMVSKAEQLNKQDVPRAFLRHLYRSCIFQLLDGNFFANSPSAIPQEVEPGKRRWFWNISVKQRWFTNFHFNNSYSSRKQRNVLSVDSTTSAMKLVFLLKLFGSRWISNIQEWSLDETNSNLLREAKQTTLPSAYQFSSSAKFQRIKCRSFDNKNTMLRHKQKGKATSQRLLWRRTTTPQSCGDWTIAACTNAR